MPPVQEIPARAKQILEKPGFIVGADAAELRDLLADLTWLLLQSSNELGRMCLGGELVGVLKLLTSSDGRPDLTRRSRPLGLSYVDFLVIGYTANEEFNSDTTSRYIKLLNILLSAGVPVNNPDFAGRTALHHAAKSSGTGEVIKVLLKYKASVDIQDRFGASPLLIAIQEDAVGVIPVFLDAGASLDVTDGEGSSPRSSHPTRPSAVSNVVKDWLVRHKGKGAILKGDRCSKCGAGSASMKRCSRCRSQLYCSPACQAADWGEHKTNCQPFDKEENLIIVKPEYTFGNFSHFSSVSLIPSSFGHTVSSNPSGTLEANVRDGKNMVIKVQIPCGSVGGILIYNKKRNFECVLTRNENPTAYGRIQELVKAKGILGLKAYFQAELRSKYELAINVGEYLPESRF